MVAVKQTNSFTMYCIHVHMYTLVVIMYTNVNALYAMLLKIDTIVLLKSIVLHLYIYIMGHYFIYDLYTCIAAKFN